MPPGFEPLYPGGMRIAQRFNAGTAAEYPRVPKGRPNLSSLRDLSHTTSTPSVETLGYFRFLWNRSDGPIPQILAVLDCQSALQQIANLRHKRCQMELDAALAWGKAAFFLLAARNVCGKLGGQ